MKAVVFHGKEDVRVEDVPNPKIMDEKDVVVQVTSTAICGSDLHMYDGYVVEMKEGDILGHEFMGVVIEVGKDVKKLKVGDRIAVPFNIACGSCDYCKRDMTSLCDNTNPDHHKLEALHGFAGAGLFGYSHLYGGYAGGQAEFVRVPFADVNHIKIPESLPDEKVLFLTDIFPTGYMAAENANIQAGDTIAIWGCGPVGQFAIRSAMMLGAEKVIAIDRFPERLRMAEDAGAVTINYQEQKDVIERIKELTNNKGPKACIDAVGMEAHGTGLPALYDKAKQAVRLETDRPTALREVIQACGKGGTVSIPGVYVGMIDKFPMGAAFGKGLTMKMGQTHVHKYLKKLLSYVENGVFDPSFIITHRLKLDEAADGYKMFRDKQDECIKVVLKP